MRGARALHPADTPLAERSNMVYAGTGVSEGSGLAIVSETGRSTEMARIQALIAETAAPPTPLERQLERMGRRRARSPRNRMTVYGWHFGERDLVIGPGAVGRVPARADGLAAATKSDPRLEQALTIGVLCNEADLVWTGQGQWEVNGSGTEVALLAAALQGGINYRDLRRRYPLVSLRPRLESENWMATIHDAGPLRRVIMVKGAPEEVIEMSTSWSAGASAESITPRTRQAILEANAALANRGMRVLGLAFKETTGDQLDLFEGLVWVGLVALTDPIRDGVREAIAACHRAGIQTVMITGDQSLTALAVARELGLVRNGQIRVLEASQLVRADEQALRRFAREVAVFARVSPAHKHQIVRALQAEGEVVAMTGDGINDGPALWAADISVAMGARGTELARELADVVLLDDDFGSIVGAVEQGRTIYANIRKALNFLLSTDFSEILVTLGALALGMPRPLAAIHFLWINLLSDVAPARALAVEPANPDVMTQSPRSPEENILSSRALARIAIDAAVISGATLGAYGVALARYGAGARASTVGFTALTCGQLVHALSCRSTTRSGFSELERSPALVGALAATLGLQASAVMASPLRRLLGTTPLSLGDWGVVTAGAVIPLIAKELTKALNSTGKERRA